MLTGRWHPDSGHFAVQRPVSYRILTSVRSALSGRVRSRKSFSRTSLELTGRWHPASGPLSLNIWSVPDDCSGSNELTRLTLQCPVTTRPASDQYQMTAIDQMNWPDSPSSVRSEPDQRLVNHWTLHSLPTRNPI